MWETTESYFRSEEGFLKDTPGPDGGGRWSCTWERGLGTVDGRRKTHKEFIRFELIRSSESLNDGYCE